MSEPQYPPPLPGGNDPTLPYPAQNPYGQGYPQPQYAYPGAAPAYVPQVDQWGRPLSDKSKIVAGVLGIALGGFGAGRFYTGHTGMAIAQLAVTIVTCGIGHFWGMIDGILILANGGTDAQGRVLRDS
jgi:TM2 domain-containing membrane protein YozV